MRRHGSVALLPRPAGRCIGARQNDSLSVWGALFLRSRKTAHGRDDGLLQERQIAGTPRVG